MKKIYTIFIVFFFTCVSVCAQETFFNSTSYVHSNGKDARLYSVDIDAHITYVVIELTATKNQSFMQILVGDNPYIVADDYENNNFLGILSDGEKPFEKIPCGANVGPRNVKKGEVYYITLLFFGRIPPGCKNFSLIDNQGSCHGYSFKNYTLNNPDTHPHSTYFFESELKNVIANNNDGIVGIYEKTSGENRYKLACIKQDGRYRLVYISGGASWWHTGEIKANLTETATMGLFKCEWYMADKSIEDDWYITFDGKAMETMDSDGDKDLYIKMYPSVSTTTQQPQEWSGSGFALGNGYIVTNNHVTDNARKIIIKGVDGDFNTGYSAQVVATDKVNDIAILRINDNHFTNFGTLPYSVSSRMADVGEDIFVLGYPLTQSMGDEIKLTNGIISSRTGFQGDVATYQMSAPIQPGNSGGPMFDGKGNVIGIVCAHHAGAENAGYAIKTSYLKLLIESAGLNIKFPTNNTISSLSLTEKVKRVKKYVFYIECSK